MHDKKNSIDLTRAYQEASLNVTERTAKSGAATPAELKVHIVKLLNEVTIGLETAGRESIRAAAQQGARQGVAAASRALERVFNGRAVTRKDLLKEGLTPKSEAAAQALIKAQTPRHCAQAVTRAAFLELHSTLRQVKKQVTDDVAATLRELAQTGENTVTRAKEVIKAKFAEEGIFKVTYSNGAQVDCADYAAMVARSARTESANAASVSQALRMGTDLVQCRGNDITCPVCAQYRNRVFSVTGSDKRFPPLRGGANSPLKGGYDQIHPNCRCEFLPYFEEFRSPEEVQRDIAYSNRPYRDDRTLRQKEEYQAWQAKNRQLREELNEYEAMRNTLGKDMPYTTLAGFRRAKRSFTELKNSEALDKKERIEYNTYRQTRTRFKDAILQGRIKSGEFKLDIHEGKQGKHIPGHNNYIEGRSYLTIDNKEAHDLVIKFAGTGEIKRDKNGRWQYQEIVDCHKTIGYDVDMNSGTVVPTTLIKIHYSNNGTHVVPFRRKE